MQTATSEREIKSRHLSICVHHYTLRAPCPEGQGNARFWRERLCVPDQDSRHVRAIPWPSGRWRARRRIDTGHAGRLPSLERARGHLQSRCRSGGRVGQGEGCRRRHRSGGGPPASRDAHRRGRHSTAQRTCARRTGRSARRTGRLVGPIARDGAPLSTPLDGVRNRRRAAATTAGAQARWRAGHRGRFEPRISQRAVCWSNSRRWGEAGGQGPSGPCTVYLRQGTWKTLNLLVSDFHRLLQGVDWDPLMAVFSYKRHTNGGSSGRKTVSRAHFGTVRTAEEVHVRLKKRAQSVVLRTDGGHKRVSCIQKLVSGTLFSCKQLARDLRGFVQSPCTGCSPFAPKWTFLASPGSVCFSLRPSLLVLLPTRTPSLLIINPVTYTTLPSPHLHPPRMHITRAAKNGSIIARSYSGRTGDIHAPQMSGSWSLSSPNMREAPHLIGTPVLSLGGGGLELDA